MGGYVKQIRTLLTVECTAVLQKLINISLMKFNQELS